MHKITILTLFPEIFPGPLAYSLAGKAILNNVFSIEAVNLRKYSQDKSMRVDDRVFGGGAGMLLRADVVARAIDDALKNTPDAKLVYFTPRGEKLTQKIASEVMSDAKNIIILCGRYEGVDQRIFEKYNFLEISIGDYILSGGEVAAITFLDAVIRTLPGVINNPDVNKEESFTEMNFGQVLEYDQYTRPAIWEGMEVPKVLLSGNHQEIANWRFKNSIERTKKYRPDLLKNLV